MSVPSSYLITAPPRSRCPGGTDEVPCSGTCFVRASATNSRGVASRAAMLESRTAASGEYFGFRLRERSVAS